MSHEKRFLLAMGLTIAFLYVWFEFMVPKPKPVAVKSPVTTSATPGVSVSPTPAAASPTTTALPESVYKKPKDVEAIDTEVSFTVPDPLYTARYTNQGGVVKSVVLQKYHREVKDPESHVQVIPLGAEAKSPLGLEFTVDGVSVADETITYQTAVDRGVKTKHPRHFFADLFSKLQVEKGIAFSQDQYQSTWEINLTNTSLAPFKLGVKTFLSAALPPAKSGGFLAPKETPIRATSYINDESHHWSLEDLQKTPKIPVGDISWAGFDSQYFLLAALPEQGRWQSMDLQKTGDKEMQLSLVYPEWTLEPGKTLSYRIKLYAGPKDISALKGVAPSLDRAIDLGNWLGLVARPMLSFLRWVHGLIPNYGVAIILLTILVRLLLTPLTAMQAKSMKKMQEHKPMMDELKERFKDNKEAYSRELMTYMRTHKINPMGGCLLLLPQLPIFFALYRVLYNSIELRHEPFLFWIRDLAAHDPYFVLPALLGIAMFFQQKLTPTPSADEAQQMMMKIMPVMFTVFMLFLPAGLNLYILVSTLWGVAQQYKIQHGFSLANKSIKKVS